MATEKKVTPSAAQVRFREHMKGINIPADLHAALTAWAEEEERGVGRQLIFILRKALREAGR